MTLRSLIEAAGKGDAAAFTELTRQYQNMVFGYAYSLLGDFHLAEDAAQETFITAYFNLSKLRDADAFPAWLRGIARHQCSRFTRRKNIDSVNLDEVTEAATTARGPQDQLESNEIRQQVLAAINALPQPQREVTILYYLQEHSQKEIARFLGVPATTINNRLHAARQRLRRRMFTMVKETLRESALPAGFAEKIGQIIQVRGPIVDVRFNAPDQPQNFDLLTVVDNPTESAGSDNAGVQLQVAQRLDDGSVRSIAVGPSGANSHAPVELKPGMAVTNAGLDQDSRGCIAGDDIERAVELLGHPRPEHFELLETGIKLLDLFCPCPRGGKLGFFGAGGNGATLLLAELFHRLAETPEGLSIFYFVRRLDAPGLQDLVTKEPFHPGDRVGTVQNFWVLTDNANNPDYAATADFLDASVCFSPMLFVQGLYPALDPLICTSRHLSPDVVGAKHYETAQRARQALLRTKELLVDPVFLEYVAHRANGPARARFDEFLAARLLELSTADRLLVTRTRKFQKFLTQPFFVAQPYTGRSGEFVSRTETLRVCNEILDGRHDSLPDEDFYMIGTLG